MMLAERVNATIVSADSRQIYRGFDIGTSKPSLAERERVPHEGIDVADPSSRYSAAMWSTGAAAWIGAARAAGRAPLVVGGTGFYMRALTAPLFAEPELDGDRRRALQRELGSRSIDELRRWCATLDPRRAHLGRAQLLRAIEVALLTGVPISAWHERERGQSAQRARYIVVDPGASLGARIEQRVRSMFDAGWADEVRALSEHIPADAPAWNATGYAAVRDVVLGRVSRDDALQRIIIATRQYAKRQRTWFRNQLQEETARGDVLRLDPNEPAAIDRALSWCAVAARSETDI